MPDDCGQRGSAVKQTSPVAEVTLGEDSELAGSAEADLRVQSEQRAMQESLRFQKLSMQALQAADVLKERLPCRFSHPWRPRKSVCQPAFRMASSTNQCLDAPYQCAFAGHAVQVAS